MNRSSYNKEGILECKKKIIKNVYLLSRYNNFCFGNRLMLAYKSRLAQETDKQQMCRMHNQRIIHIGSCLTCHTAAPICEAKGCIKHHQ